jgi:hypothetical protein
MRWMAVSVVALSLALPAAARAGDLCLDAAGAAPPAPAAPVVVLRAFKLPKPNKCRPVAGVIAAFPGINSSAVTGSACTSHDGANVTFTIVATVGPTIGGGFIHPATELRYSARLQPDGKDSGTGLMTAFDAMSTREFTAYECHDAYPDNV